MQRGLKIVNQTERLRTAELLHGCLSRWQQKWWQSGVSPVELTPAEDAGTDEPVDSAWYLAKMGHNKHACAAISVTGAGLLAGSLLNVAIGAEAVQSPTSVLRRLEDAAWQDLLNTVLSASHHDETTESVEVFKAEGLGAAGSKCSYDGLQCFYCEMKGDIRFCIYLWPDAIDQWLMQDRPAFSSDSRVVQSMYEAIDNETLCLDVHTGEADISVEDLAALSIGHVIRLNRKLDKPVDLYIDGSYPVCKGYLGTHDQHMAVKLAKRV